MPRDPRQHWNERYRERETVPAEPSPFLIAQEAHLPPPGHALDVAGGAGRNALWLARQGWDVTVVDIAAEGLALARLSAEQAGLEIHTLERDLESDGLPAGPFDLVISFHYLYRPLFSAWPEILAPGGLLIFEQPTLTNLERHPRPPARYCLEPGELPGLVEHLEVLHTSEGWDESGHHEACLVARQTVSVGPASVQSADD